MSNEGSRVDRHPRRVSQHDVQHNPVVHQRRNDDQVSDVAVQHGAALAGQPGHAAATFGSYGCQGGVGDIVPAGRQRSDLFAGEQAGQQRFSLFFIAHPEHGLDREHRRRERNWCQRPAELAERDRRLDQGGTHPTVFRRRVQRGQLELATQPLPHPPVVAVGRGHLTHPRRWRLVAKKAAQ